MMGRFRILDPRRGHPNPEAGPERRQAIVDVRIEVNAGPAAEYRLDANKAPRLVAVHPPTIDRLPGDMGQVVGSAGPDGEPLCAIVAGDVSVHPGAIASGRVVGLVRPDGGERGWLVVAPVADATVAEVQDPQTLPETFQQRLRRFAGADTLVWTGPEEAERTARAAVERGRRQQAQERAERAAAEAAWSPTPGAQRRWATYEGETHTQAELDLFRVPYRFQLYLREVLLPQERLLASVHRPPQALGRWPFGQQTEHEAMLLLTDHQLLVLSDALPLHRLMALGGFVARATAVERIADVRLEPAGEQVRLCVDLRSARRPTQWTIRAPTGTAVESLALLASRFVPRPGEALPARRGHVEPVEVATTGWHTFFPHDAREEWRARLAAVLGADQRLLAWALTPAMPAEGSPTAALALTSERFLVIGETEVLGTWTMGELTSVELRSSPFASTFLLWTTGATPALAMPFPFTVVPAFLDLFLAVRRRLAAFPLE